MEMGYKHVNIIIAVVFIVFIIGFFISAGRASRRRRTGGFANAADYTPNYPENAPRTTKRGRGQRSLLCAAHNAPGIGNYKRPSSTSSGSWWSSGSSGGGQVSGLQRRRFFKGRRRGQVLLVRFFRQPLQRRRTIRRGREPFEGGGFSRGGGAGRGR
jgi:hypothetical protein